MDAPKHSKSHYFAELFSDLDSFKQLEARISLLPSKKERGDAFEVLAEAYFSVVPGLGNVAVWPFEKISKRLASALGLDTSRDMGVDGLTELQTGDFQAYQVKFRTNRRALTWEKLSTFMGLTDQVKQRVLFTNSNDLPDLMNDRTGFYCIRGNDLDRLEKRDFAAIHAWLVNVQPIYEVKTPLPHQEEAINAIEGVFDKDNRTTAVMACGTGKTLIALWVAQRRKAKTVIVFLPSLALIRQTLHEWVKEAVWHDASYLCVCSDSTVSNIDSINIKQSDLDFPVTTDTSEILNFLQSDCQRKVIFTTYQSSPTIVMAVGKKYSFDLGVFDEAHKTAGREGTKFSFALSDDNIKISKRLFLTATPRHYQYRTYNSGVHRSTVYSMDDSRIYGNRSYTLSFGEAASRGIICDYKVVVSVVTSNMLNEEMRRRGEVLVGGKNVRAQQVTNQIALTKAIERYGVGRIITFHSSVKSAKSFVAEDGEGVAAHLPGLDTFHVNGGMNTALRDSIISAFRESDQALITNARCLTEGVDVPAVDMVAFMSPKRSRIDIVQAVGRAMRKSANKKCGYVLVPLYIEEHEGESLEESLDRTGFTDIWLVLKAMQEQDEELAETISEIRAARGRDAAGYDDARLRENVSVIGPEILLEEIEAGINTRLIEHFGVAWMPFKEARIFARSLGLTSAEQWSAQYCKGLLSGFPPKPLGIPSAPNTVYQSAGWISWSDWLNTGRGSNWREFEKAREFVRSLNIESRNHWYDYCKNGKDGGPKPEDIPSEPRQAYKDKGWAGYPDWLGLKATKRRVVNKRPFLQARAFARSLRLKSSREWKDYAAGKRSDLPPLPNDLPTNPMVAYKEDYISFADWLGVDMQSYSGRRQRKWREFGIARDYVRSLGIKTSAEYRKWSSGGLPHLPPKPDDIPAKPESVYWGQGWISYPDWLGKNTKAIRSFESARDFVRSLGLKSNTEWRQYVLGKKPNLPPLPDDIPKWHPNKEYADQGWMGWKDYLTYEEE